MLINQLKYWLMINEINVLSSLRPDEQDLVTAWATPALEMACTKLASLPSNIICKKYFDLTLFIEYWIALHIYFPDWEYPHLVPGETTGYGPSAACHSAATSFAFLFPPPFPFFPLIPACFPTTSVVTPLTVTLLLRTWSKCIKHHPSVHEHHQYHHHQQQQQHDGYVVHQVLLLEGNVGQGAVCATSCCKDKV